MSDDRKLAMFMDFENIVRGVKEAQYKQFEIKLVLERLVEKGKIMVKRAYADWNRYAEYKRPFHEHAIELIDVPQSRYSGKNSADIRMVVDAMDLAYAKQHVDSFALVSGGSDFSPLVSKLRENDRYVIGLGVKSSSSELLVGNHAIDANKSMPSISTIINNNWYFHATINTPIISHFSQGQGGKVVVAYFLREPTPYPLDWFEEWNKPHLPDPIKTYANN
jgi:uncharacterized protein (TIGR00288 family)